MSDTSLLPPGPAAPLWPGSPPASPLCHGSGQVETDRFPLFLPQGHVSLSRSELPCMQAHKEVADVVV